MTAIERGILFSAPMVRKILGNQKYQTRRVKKTYICPYGRVGDLLWVRETWGLHAYGDDSDWFRGSIRGMSEESLRAQYNLVMRADWGPVQEGCYWRPAIFMPRWASRITLEVTEIRVQNLQEISDDDALAEGVGSGLIPANEDRPLSIGYVFGHDDGKCTLYPTERRAFEVGWNSINGKHAPWASNPIVWAISFKKPQ